MTLLKLPSSPRICVAKFWLHSSSFLHDPLCLAFYFSTALGNVLLSFIFAPLAVTYVQAPSSSNKVNRVVGGFISSNETTKTAKFIGEEEMIAEAYKIYKATKAKRPPSVRFDTPKSKHASCQADTTDSIVTEDTKRSSVGTFGQQVEVCTEDDQTYSTTHTYLNLVESEPIVTEVVYRQPSDACIASSEEAMANTDASFTEAIVTDVIYDSTISMADLENMNPHFRNSEPIVASVIYGEVGAFGDGAVDAEIDILAATETCAATATAVQLRVAERVSAGPTPKPRLPRLSARPQATLRASSMVEAVMSKDVTGCSIYIVAHNYAPEHTDELALSVGDEIQVISKPDGGWWEGNLNSMSGWFPANHTAAKHKRPAPVTPQANPGHNPGITITETQSILAETVTSPGWCRNSPPCPPSCRSSKVSLSDTAAMESAPLMMRPTPVMPAPVPAVCVTFVRCPVSCLNMQLVGKNILADW